jgi:hypothetical protein
MGSNVSKNGVDQDSGTNNSTRDRSNKICIDCQKDKQVAYPGGNDSGIETDTSNNTNPCDDLYQKVDVCMKNNQGQISSCVSEWKFFNECFTRHKAEQQRNLS